MYFVQLIIRSENYIYFKCNDKLGLSWWSHTIQLFWDCFVVVAGLLISVDTKRVSLGDIWLGKKVVPPISIRGLVGMDQWEVR